MCADDHDRMGTSGGPAHLLKIVHAPVDPHVWNSPKSSLHSMPPVSRLAQPMNNLLRLHT